MVKVRIALSAWGQAWHTWDQESSLMAHDFTGFRQWIRQTHGILNWSAMGLEGLNQIELTFESEPQATVFVLKHG